MEFTTIRIRQDGPFAYLELNRPDKANAIDERMWQELRAAMQWVDRTEAVRVAVLSGAAAISVPALTCPCWKRCNASPSSNAADEARSRYA